MRQKTKAVFFFFFLCLKLLNNSSLKSPAYRRTLALSKRGNDVVVPER